MISCQRWMSGIWVLVLLLVFNAMPSLAQPILPDITGSEDNGIVLLSWTCQYDGVKSIAVLRSSDSGFNYATIGYVKRLYKGVQAFADGHPLPGKNYYRLSVVFNSGLSWTCNHYEVNVDADHLTNRRAIPSNEALQKLIVNEPSDKPEKNKPKPPLKPADRNKYVTTPTRDTAGNNPVPRKLTLSGAIDEHINELMEPEPEKHKIVVTYSNDEEPNGEDPYASEVKKTDKAEATKPATSEGQVKAPEPRKRISLTFEDKDDIDSYVDALPKSASRKITVSFNDNGEDGGGAVTTKRAEEPKKKISVTFDNDAELHSYLENLPKEKRPKITVSYNMDSAELAKARQEAAAKARDDAAKAAAAKPKISIKFSDELTDNAATGVKAKYVYTDPITGHVLINMPEDIAIHHYALKFYDKENHMVLEVPHISATHIILDRRNFQKKGTYRFVVRKEGVELESGYVAIF